MIKKIKIKIRRSDDSGLFHNSRLDTETLRKVCNELIDKVNELTEEVNNLKQKENK